MNNRHVNFFPRRRPAALLSAALATASCLALAGPAMAIEACPSPSVDIGGGVCEAAFSSSGSFTLPPALNFYIFSADILAVGGGGGGGGAMDGGEGGGGAGGQSKICQLLLASNPDFATPDTWTVTVGLGGAGGSFGSGGVDGNPSSVAVSAVPTTLCWAAYGYGGKTGSPGGSDGGDATAIYDGDPDGSEWPTEPPYSFNSGGTGSLPSAGGGGAGTGGNGTNASGSSGGEGGAGRSSYTGLFSAFTTELGGGGGGGAAGSGGTGAAGGGNGGVRSDSTSPTAGSANTGGGGGGGARFVASDNGAEGGSGLVLIRFNAIQTLYVVPDPQTVSVGDAVPTYTFQYCADAGCTVQVPIPPVTSPPSCNSSYAPTTTPAGTFPTISCSGGTPGANLAFNFDATANGTVNKGTLCVKPDGQSVNEGAPPPTYTFKYYAAGCGGSAFTPSPSVTNAPSCSSDYTSGMSAGDSPRTITCSSPGTADPSYDYTTTATADLTINAGPVTVCVKPDPKTVSYGDPIPAYTFGYYSDAGCTVATTAPAGSTAPTCSSPYTSSTSVSLSPLTISCSGGSAGPGNPYTFQTNSLTINPVSLYIAPDDKTVKYGDRAPKFTFKWYLGPFDQSKRPAVVTKPTCSSAYTNSPPTPTQVSDSPLDIGCSGGDPGPNFTFVYPGTPGGAPLGKLTVTPAHAVKVTPQSATWTSGQTPPPFSFTTSGFKSGDDFSKPGMTGPTCEVWTKPGGAGGGGTQVTPIDATTPAGTYYNHCFGAATTSNYKSPVAYGPDGKIKVRSAP